LTTFLPLLIACYSLIVLNLKYNHDWHYLSMNEMIV
jgi:hypothetical protein